MDDRSPSEDAGSGPEPSIDKFDTGLELVMAAQTLGDAYDAVDVAALREDGTLEEAIDAEQLGAALGRPAGHLIARRAIGDAAGDGIAGTLAREAAGRAGARVARVAIDRVDYTSS